MLVHLTDAEQQLHVCCHKTMSSREFISLGNNRKGQKQRQNEAVCLNASWSQGELGQSGPNALVDPMETIMFNHSLSHTHNHMRDTERKHTPHTHRRAPSCQSQPVNESPSCPAKPCCTGARWSKRPETDVHVPNASENRPGTVLKR